MSSNKQHRDDQDFGDGSNYPKFEPLIIPQTLILELDEYEYVDINLDDLEDCVILTNNEDVEGIAITEKPTKPISEAALKNSLVLMTL